MRRFVRAASASPVMYNESWLIFGGYSWPMIPGNNQWFPAIKCTISTRASKRYCLRTSWFSKRLTDNVAAAVACCGDSNHTRTTDMLVSFTQTSRGTSDENRLRQRGSGEKRQFSCCVSVWCPCDTNHSSVLGWSCDLARLESFGRHFGTIEYFQFLWGHFLCNYIDSNINFYINYTLLLKFECFNLQELLEMHFCSKIVDLSYERGR